MDFTRREFNLIVLSLRSSTEHKRVQAGRLTGTLEGLKLEQKQIDRTWRIIRRFNQNAEELERLEAKVVRQRDERVNGGAE